MSDTGSDRRAQIYSSNRLFLPRKPPNGQSGRTPPSRRDFLLRGTAGLAAVLLSPKADLAETVVTSETSAQLIGVTSPGYRSTVRGDTMIDVHASGYQSPLISRSWQPLGRYGSDAIVASVRLDRNGDGSFNFPAQLYPNGPIALRITGRRVSDGYVDTCYLQLYNTGGVTWREGIPKLPPPAAVGMSLVFADDFDGPLSISSTGMGARYAAHKPDGEDFGEIPFSDPSAAGPFFQRDTYLIIQANALLRTTGLISSVGTRGKGFTVKSPFYMECRFIAPDAPGTWPAWWALTDNYDGCGWGKQNDEIDIIEAYGGDGPGNPNSSRIYMVTPHTWGYRWPTDVKRSLPVPMKSYGGGGGWADTPHTYGLLVTQSDFTFYLDDLQVMRLPASPIAEIDPVYFMVNLAVGGNGWPVNLSRYGNIVDMYVDYIRVYH